MTTESVRAELLARLDVLLNRRDRLATHLRNDDGRLEADPEDRASLVGMDEVVEDIDEAGRTEIGAIRSALERLEAGTWGTCSVCGEAISPKRLAALPEASTCVGCAA